VRVERCAFDPRERKHNNVPTDSLTTLSGILNIDKPAGWTSHDVVGWVRRVLHEKRVGHAGTLDPMATGVLLVCVGQATRVAEYLMGGEKVYRAEVKLGVVTDTYDADGQVIATAPLPPLTADDLRPALAGFVGEIAQVPPAYSAITQDGVAAYRKARRGDTVELAARPVSIYEIELLDWSAPRLTIEVMCGPGTYIRSLAHDLGQAVGCGAMLSRLVRLRSGRFTLDDAVGLDDLADACRAGELARYLHPLEAALHHLTRVPVDADQAAWLVHGQAIPCPGVPAAETGYAVDPSGTVVAILAYDPKQVVWRPHKVFGTSNE
jgi:tRNA pseudouridine55 synthase